MRRVHPTLFLYLRDESQVLKMRASAQIDIGGGDEHAVQRAHLIMFVLLDVSEQC
jgi:hypothetical protein